MTPLSNVQTALRTSIPSIKFIWGESLVADFLLTFHRNAESGDCLQPRSSLTKSIMYGFTWAYVCGGGGGACMRVCACVCVCVHVCVFVDLYDGGAQAPTQSTLQNRTKFPN